MTQPTIEQLAQQNAALLKRVEALERKLREEVTGVEGSPGAINRRIKSLADDFAKRLTETRSELAAARTSLSELLIDIRGDKTTTNPGLLADVFEVKTWKNSSTAQINFARAAFGTIAFIGTGFIWSLLTGSEGITGIKDTIKELQTEIRQIEVEAKRQATELEWIKHLHNRRKE
jgi:hypothetical protein